MAENDWIEFVGTLRNLGNKGKSRGINISMITNKNDIGRHLVGRFCFTDSEPDITEITSKLKKYKSQKQIFNHLEDILKDCEKIKW